MPGPHPTNRPGAPTAGQLRYLRALANSRGETFTYPRTKAEASAEIQRLQNATAESRLDREVERVRLQREVEVPVDAAAVQDDEITGHGANAHWNHTPGQRPEPIARQHELGRYELPGGNVRALVGERIRGRVAVTDVPKTYAGRVYLVERHVQSQAELDALVAAYLEDSTRRGGPAALVPTDPELDQ